MLRRHMAADLDRARRRPPIVGRHDKKLLGQNAAQPLTLAVGAHPKSPARCEGNQLNYITPPELSVSFAEKPGAERIASTKLRMKIFADLCSADERGPAPILLERVEADVHTLDGCTGRMNIRQKLLRRHDLFVYDRDADDHTL